MDDPLFSSSHDATEMALWKKKPESRKCHYWPRSKYNKGVMEINWGIEHHIPSSDGKVRDVEISYKIQRENGDYDGQQDIRVNRSQISTCISRWRAGGNVTRCLNRIK